MCGVRGGATDDEVAAFAATGVYGRRRPHGRLDVADLEGDVMRCEGEGEGAAGGGGRGRGGSGGGAAASVAAARRVTDRARETSGASPHPSPWVPRSPARAALEEADSAQGRPTAAAAARRHRAMHAGISRTTEARPSGD